MKILLDKKWLNFGTRSLLDPDLRFFDRFLSTARWDNLTYISGKTDWIFMRLLSLLHLRTRKFPLSFGSCRGAQLIRICTPAGCLTILEIYWNFFPPGNPGSLLEIYNIS